MTRPLKFLALFWRLVKFRRRIWSFLAPSGTAFFFSFSRLLRPAGKGSKSSAVRPADASKPDPTRLRSSSS